LPDPSGARLLIEIIVMNAAYIYLIASSWIFLLGWIVMLLVACALAFQGDSA
jgi:hypothetical protein